MIQHKQIGKYKNKQSVIEAKIGKSFLTPNGYQYIFINRGKINNKFHYVYNWDNCPEEILSKLNTTRIVSLTELTPSQIDICITEMIKIANEN